MISGFPFQQEIEATERFKVQSKELLNHHCPVFLFLCSNSLRHIHIAFALHIEVSRSHPSWINRQVTLHLNIFIDAVVHPITSSQIPNLLLLHKGLEKRRHIWSLLFVLGCRGIWILSQKLFLQRDAKRGDFVTELLDRYLEPYLTYLEQVLPRLPSCMFLICSRLILYHT